MRSLAVICAHLLMLAWPGNSLGQEAECTTCRVALVQIARLSSAGAAVMPSTEVSAARLANGTYVVSPLWGTPALLQYDAAGRLLRTYDKRGNGPGELNAPPRVFTDLDGILNAFCGKRLIRFDTALTHIKTVNVDIAPQTRAVFIAGGKIAVDAMVRTDNNASYTFHWLTPSGTLERSFEPTVEPAGPLVMAGSSSGGLWVARRNDSELRLIATILPTRITYSLRADRPNVVRALEIKGARRGHDRSSAAA